jgi:hypothetical protein
MPQAQLVTWGGPSLKPGNAIAPTGNMIDEYNVACAGWCTANGVNVGGSTKSNAEEANFLGNPMLVARNIAQQKCIQKAADD